MIQSPTPETVPSRSNTAAQNVVAALVAAGAEAAFTVPGESFLGVLDALYDEKKIRTVATRHEGGAAFMADAYSKVSGKLSICMGTRAVGAGNLAIGIHNAQQDSVPVVAILGQVSTRARYRESFQETELPAMLGPITKWAVEPVDAASMGDLTYRAARIALEGRPGPVALSMREDLLVENVPEKKFATLQPARLYPDPSEVDRVLALLRSAHKPVMLLGVDVLNSQARDLYVRLSEQETLPAISIWRRPDTFPNEHPFYLGMSGLSSPPVVSETLREADLIMVVGGRLDENTTADYTIPESTCTVIHVDVDAGRLVPSGDGAGIVAHADAFANALLGANAAPLDAGVRSARQKWVEARRATWETQTIAVPREVGDGFADQFAVFAQMRDLMPDDAIVVSDAGNFSGWVSRFLRWSRPGSFIGSGAGAMGYGVPGAIGAQLAKPDQAVVAIAGDGGFMMTAIELQTAAREQLPITVVVIDNARYGTIRMHQEMHFPGRPIATELGQTDFVGLAISMGCEAELVTDARDFGAAFSRAVESNLPFVVVVRVDPRQISVGSPGLMGD